MRLSAHDEYGVRLLLRIAKGEPDTCMTTALLAEREGISMSHAGKVLRLLRQGGFVESTRGNCGGYKLSLKPTEITVSQVLKALDGQLIDDDLSDKKESLCTNSIDCSMRSLWKMVQYNVDSLLLNITLEDLIAENDTVEFTLEGKRTLAGKL